MEIESSVEIMNSRDYEKFINQILINILDIDIEHYEKEVEKALERIGTYFSVDRAYMYFFSEDPTFMKIDCQWSRIGIKPKRDLVQDEVVYELPWLIREIKNREFVVIGDLIELPDDAFIEKDILNSEGIKSCVFFPLKSKDDLIGFIGFETLKKTIVWNDRHNDLLLLISKALSSIRIKIFREKYFETTLFGQSLLLNNSDAQLWALKNTTVYGSMNEAHAEFFGKSKKELEHQDIYDIFPVDIANKLCEGNWELFQKNEPAQRELYLKNWKGEERLLLIKSRPKKDKFGNAEYLVCTAEDITDQRKSQDDLYKAKIEAEAANLAKSYFLANMSHEIRTPMNGIMGFMELLSTTALNDEQNMYVKEARMASELLLNILNDILDFSKIEAGMIVLEEIDFNIRSMVNNAVKLSIPKAVEKGLEIFTIIKSNTPYEVKGDPGRLRQILSNLINNAVKFTENGEIVITVEMLEEEDDAFTMFFQVSDTGIGIAEEDIAKLFTQFTQVDASTTRKYGGTGLGLTISKRFVDLMKGKINLESRLGEGSNFSFTCRFKKSSYSKKIVINNYDSIKDRRVLIIDTNKTSRMILKDHLEEAGCGVELVKNGVEAISELVKAASTDFPYSFVISNLHNLDTNSFNLVQAIRNNPLIKDLFIMIMVYFAQKGEANLAREKGCDAFLTKPITKDELLSCLCETLQTKYIADKKDVDSENVQSENIITKHSIRDAIYDRNAKILLVEDNATNQKLMCIMLEKVGYICDLAENGQVAVDACRKKDYNLILMDCQMPVMSGYEATAEIRVLEGNSKHTIIVAMTANAMIGDREKCIEVGMDDYLSKPIKKEDLERLIKKHIKKDEI